MTLRFLKCVAVVTLVHLMAALLVFGAYHFTKVGNGPEEGVPAARQDFTLVSTQGEEAKPVKKPEAKVHNVVRGDSYWTIARQYGVKMDDLMADNGHSRDHVLKIGESLVIPHAN
jgi:LysM repeat protein